MSIDIKVMEAEVDERFPWANKYFDAYAQNPTPQNHYNAYFALTRIRDEFDEITYLFYRTVYEDMHYDRPGNVRKDKME